MPFQLEKEEEIEFKENTFEMKNTFFFLPWVYAKITYQNYFFDTF